MMMSDICMAYCSFGVLVTLEMNERRESKIKMQMLNQKGHKGMWALGESFPLYKFSGLTLLFLFLSTFLNYGDRCLMYQILSTVL